MPSEVADDFAGILCLSLGRYKRCISVGAVAVARLNTDLDLCRNKVQQP